MPDSPGARAFVLGLDGVPWGFVREHATPETLPNFARLLDEGAAGPLESTVPATTPLAWPSIATGVRPDKHGIYGFQRLTADYGQETYSSADLRQPPLWEILSPAVVGNVPMTYPASPIDGRMLAGMLTPTLDERAVHPDGLVDELAERVPDYRVALDWQEYTGDEEAFVAELCDLVERRREAMDLLLETDRWELAFFVYTAPDRLQHLVWREDVVLDHYRHLDEILGDVMDRVAAHDATLYVVSDHGFGPIEKYVAVNSALEGEGLLARADGDGGGDSAGGLGVMPSRETVASVLGAVGVDPATLRRVLPDRLFETVAANLSGQSLLYETDFAETQAFVHGPGNVYVNDAERFDDGPVDPGDRDAVKRSVRDALGDLADPETGETPVTVHDGDELFPADDASPDLVVDKVGGYECKVSFHDRVFREPTSKEGNHRSTGLFAAWGSTIRSGASVTDATVYDVAPTLLHGLGRAVPGAADGDVLTGVFASDAAPARREPSRTRYAVDEREEGGTEDYSEVHERLKGLGYME